MTIPKTVIEALVGVEPNSALADACQARREILKLSQASYDAIITPADPGGLSHAERAALAVRMARLNADAALAAHYQERLKASGDTAALALIATPGSATDHGPRLNAIVRHIDLLTCEPKEATRADIQALKDAGLSEPDIVRLSELAAFLNYQARVIAGFRLLRSAA